MYDRLIELLKTPNKAAILRKIIPHFVTEETDEESIVADYLIVNGVIAPPCKVGDTVYYYKAEIDEICPAKVIGIFNNYYTPSMPLWITIEYKSKLIGKQEEKMASEVFKLLCRYTKEEAEKALKERDQNA
jgi:hypothetical protein